LHEIEAQPPVSRLKTCLPSRPTTWGNRRVYLAVLQLGETGVSPSTLATSAQEPLPSTGRSSHRLQGRSAPSPIPCGHLALGPKTLASAGLEFARCRCAHQFVSGMATRKLLVRHDGWPRVVWLLDARPHLQQQSHTFSDVCERSTMAVDSLTERSGPPAHLRQQCHADPTFATGRQQIASAFNTETAKWSRNCKTDAADHPHGGRCSPCSVRPAARAGRARRMRPRIGPCRPASW